MEVMLSDRTPVSLALVIYPIGGDWALPLIQLSEGLGIAIQASPTLAQAEGFIIDESNRFQLDVRACTVLQNGQRTSFPCDKVVVFEDEIYVESHLLEQWLPIRMTINLFRSFIVVTPSRKLPPQLRTERERVAERMREGDASYDSGYPQREIPHSVLDGPSIDELMSFARTFNSLGDKNNFRHTTQLAGEVGGFESYAFLNGDEKKIERWRLSLSRTDAQGQLLGPLGLRQIQLLDLDMPRMPLISEAQQGRGFILSNFPLTLPTTFQTTDFQGVLPAGWEVELFRNEVFLGRRTSEGTGRYVFSNISLYYGTNRFRFSFYGPHGERRQEYKNYQIDGSLVASNVPNYRLGYARLDDKRQRLALQYAQGVSKSVSLSAGFLKDDNTTLDRPYGSAGLAWFNDLFLLNTNCALSGAGGTACEFGEQTGWDTTSLGMKYTTLSRFQSDSFNSLSQSGALQTNQIDVSLSYILPLTTGVGMTWDYIRRGYEDHSTTNRITNRSSIGIDWATLNNELNYDFESSPHLSGKANVDIIPHSTRFRVGVDYNVKQLMDVEGEIQKNVDREYSVTALLRYLLSNRIFQTHVLVAKLYDALSIAVDLGVNGPKDYSAGIQFAMSMLRNPQDGNWRFSRETLTLTGSASAQVFVDSNENGKWDPDERPLPNLALLLNQREAGGVTDAHGTLLITQIRPYLATDLSISLRSLEDPFLHPSPKGVRFYPRAGKTAVLSLPVVVRGEADGLITLVEGNKTRGKRNFEVELLNEQGALVRKVRSGYDGVYLIDELPPGKYRVRPSPEALESLKVGVRPAFHEVMISAEGGFESGMDFTLTK